MTFRQVFTVPRSREWHELRADGVCGSDVSIIMGRPTPYGSRFDLYYEKRYRDAWQYDEDDDDESEYAFWGTVLEPVIRDRFADKHPEFEVVTAGTCINEAEPWRRGNPDGLLFETTIPGGPDPERLPVAGLECKNVDGRMRDRWDDERFQGVAQGYYDQVQWCMDVTGIPVWFVAALFGGNTPREYEVAYDPDYAHVLRTEARQFWADVHAGRQPEPDGHPVTLRRLHRMHPDVIDDEVEVDDDLAEEFRASYALKKAGEKAYKAATAKLLRAVGDYRRAIDSDGTSVATRSVYPQSRIDADRLRGEQPAIASEYKKTSTVHKVTPSKPPKGKEA